MFCDCPCYKQGITAKAEVNAVVQKHTYTLLLWASREGGPPKNGVMTYEAITYEAIIRFELLDA